jgi:hypothetical protein
VFRLRVTQIKKKNGVSAVLELRNIRSVLVLSVTSYLVFSNSFVLNPLTTRYQLPASSTD